jgi:endoglucanase
MKSSRHILVAAAFIAMAVVCFTCSCGKDKPQGGDEPEVSLSVDPSVLSFTAEESSAELTVTSPSKPVAVSGESWCKTSVGTFSGGNCKVTVTVEANASTSERTASVSVVCGDLREKVSVTQAGAAEPVPEDFLAEITPGTGIAWTMAKKLGLGWDLGNQMDSYTNEVSGETLWGNAKATQATFDGLKSKGFTSVRIPVTWMGHIGAAPDYRIDESWMDRVAELVGYAEKAGLNVIVNVHHDGANSEHWLNIKKAAASASDCETITAEYKAVWKQIAEKFSDKGDFLIFEAYNEIHDGGWGWGSNRTDGGAQYKILNKWAQEFVSTVRAAGGKNKDRYLGIPGYCAHPDLTIDNLVLPTDSAKERLMVAVHCYDPYDYTLEAKYDEWGHTAKNNPAPDGEEAIVKVMAKLKAKYIDKGIPVYIGETGCSNRPTERQRKFQAYYLEFFYKACRSYGMAPFYWDNGSEAAGKESGAVINHSTGEYAVNGKAVVDAMYRAIFTESPSYTLRSVYENAPE